MNEDGAAAAAVSPTPAATEAGPAKSGKKKWGVFSSAFKAGKRALSSAAYRAKEACRADKCWMKRAFQPTRGPW